MSLRIVQISDTHLCVDAPLRLHDLENCIRVINEMQFQPDAVVHTGDITHNGLSQEYHSARELLDQLHAPYFVMAGNRDKREPLLHEFRHSRFQLPEQGWVQYVVEDFSSRLIMLDTLSDQSNKGKLCNSRLAHLEKMLSANPGKPVVLFLHHPPYEAKGIPDPYQYENWNDVEKLENLLIQHNQIQGIYCGHVHRFIDGSIADIAASAISCLAGDLRWGDVSDSERKLPVLKLLSFGD